jgi:hypothetical protein
MSMLDTIADRVRSAGLAIDTLVLFEPPFSANDVAATSDRTARVAELVVADRRRDAVDHFLTSIGVPADVLDQMEASGRTSMRCPGRWSTTARSRTRPRSGW